MRERIVAGLFLLACCALSIARLIRTPTPLPATAPDTVFSAERAMRHVEAIAVRPHAMGMPDHDRVRDYVMSQITAMGLRPQLQVTTGIGTRYQVAGRVQNILAWLPGSGAQGKAVLIAVHYDGVEAGPAAADDGAGTAALLETLRALHARRTPLAHDVIALFTDGEETGLLGAAAFVREHVWAKDVAMVLNFEARGTAGRALMFETGAGNYDAARQLRAVGNATAGSVFTAVYRHLANDTDLSELGLLGAPALNFAFTRGVERYHTSHDDVAHLEVGSVQHVGDQMLGLAKHIASGALPRPKTSDAVFFDMPVVGLIVYPEGLSIPLAVVVCVLVGLAVWRSRSGVLAGTGLALVALPLSAGLAAGVATLTAAVQRQMPWGGDPKWRGVEGAAVALACVSLLLAVRAIASRWTAGGRGLWLGSLVICALLGAALAVVAPGASYLLVWPTFFAAVAALATRWTTVLEYIAAFIAAMMLVGFAYGVSVIMLGVDGGGAMALGLLTAIVVLSSLPVVDRVIAGAAWRSAGAAALGAALLVAIGAVTTRYTPDHPAPSALAYGELAGTSEAWFGSLGGTNDPWTKTFLQTTSMQPRWVTAMTSGRVIAGHPVPAVSLEAPAADVVRDTVSSGVRRLVLRVRAPQGTTSLTMRIDNAPVLSASIDGRVVDTTRFRRRSRYWIMPYWAVPDSGAIVALSLPAGRPVSFQMVARRPGLPSFPGPPIPPRPPQVVPIQWGDATYIFRTFAF